VGTWQDTALQPMTRAASVTASRMFTTAMLDNDTNCSAMILKNMRGGTIH